MRPAPVTGLFTLKEIEKMKRNTLLVLGALCLLITGPSIAADSAAHSHEHGTAAATLQLNAGQKWETDGTLRQAMGNIHQAMSASLQQIHENRLPKKGYDALAKTVQDEVGSIIANCKLEPKADAQLHLIVAELLEGADQMAGKTAKVKRQSGAVRVIGALENYGSYFDDAGFRPITH
jgi:hypothetical protein